jgi:hypothetical protein
VVVLEHTLRLDAVEHCAVQLISQTARGGVRRSIRYAWDGEMTTDSLAAGSSAAPLPILRNNAGFSRITSYGYDARGKMLTMTNTVGLAEQMVNAYAPMGNLRQSNYESQSYNFALNTSAYDYQQSRVIETISADAFGNIVTRDNIGYAGSAQSPALLSVPPRLFGGSGAWNRPGVRTSFCQAGTKRLAMTSTLDTRDTLRYDASGNTIVQQAKDTLNTSGATYFEASERVMYYDANERLAAVDSRRGQTRGTTVDRNKFYMAFDEYRYDALGRREFCGRSGPVRPRPTTSILISTRSASWGTCRERCGTARVRCMKSVCQI